MRVDIARVDALNDAIGELVIAQNMVSCSPEIRALGSRRVQTLLAQLDRVTRSIQDMSMRLRLVSIQPVFQRMVRLGRDTSKTRRSTTNRGIESIAHLLTRRSHKQRGSRDSL